MKNITNNKKNKNDNPIPFPAISYTIFILDIPTIADKT